jgi:hypothetical protein
LLIGGIHLLVGGFSLRLKFGQNFYFAGFFFEFLIGKRPDLQGIDFLNDFLGFFRVVPEIGLQGDGFLFFYDCQFLSNVKDTLLAQTRVPGALVVDLVS